MSHTITARLRNIFAENFGVDKNEIAASANLVEDLKLDSIDFIELFIAIGEEFGITIEDNQEQRVFDMGGRVRDLRQVIVEMCRGLGKSARIGKNHSAQRSHRQQKPNYLTFVKT